MRLDAERQMPDVSLAEKTEFAGKLSKVGMGKIEMPVLFAAGSQAPVQLPATIDAFVSLDDSEAKGIHMSRLYLELKNNLQMKPISASALKDILASFIHTHSDLSESAFIKIQFQAPLERKALVSGERGVRQYPVTLSAQIVRGHFQSVLGTEILYSSTCPCSTALARQLMEQEFLSQFSHRQSLTVDEVAKWLTSADSIVAFPHAQRSLARVQVKPMDEEISLSLIELIDMSEKALGTPVQAAVKRADEQEFARLNAKNLMFCEDAARKLRGIFEADKRIADYSIYVEHQESLHPHDAISVVVKGVPGGFQA